MPDTAPDAEAFARLALDLHDVDGLDETVERILEFTVKTFGCGYAGVILVHGGARVETVAATDPVVTGLDAVQLEAGEGPDLELIADRHEVIIRDVREESRWPRWCEAVADAGIRSMLGSRLYTSQQVIGSLNLYDPEPGAFDEADADVAHMLARHAAVAMQHARGDEHLRKAVDARNLVGQAQGILMERFDLDADRAFEVLRRYSQHHNTKLHLVAQQLIDSRTLPEG
ncbi:GAF and ANTAR domain-containing protein [Nocardioides terrigena]|uniref:GAF and ANTAR domain-containing protein n=1 Tax=Nocardioides terrigena TaxID=424797 RepID=UPI000D31E450|nr:GAF and ANTAR domain-containing protein [Nocardioides terrigena]